MVFPASAGTAGQVLGTDGFGNMSWVDGNSSAGYVPYRVPLDTFWTLPENKQAHFSTTIDVEGTLIVEGVLIEI